MSTKANRKPLVEMTDAELRAAIEDAAAGPAEAAAPVAIPGAERPVGVLRNVELDWLVPTPRNPRGPVDTKSESFRELVASVARVGVLQNLVARPLPEAMRRDAAAYQRKLGPVPKGAVRAFPEPADMFEVVCGARRLAAARAAGLATAPVLVCELDDRQATEITFVENFARHDLRPLQEARGVQAMLDVGWPLEAVAERVGHAPGWVARRAKLLGLSTEWQALFDDEELSLRFWPAGVMESIARLRPEAQGHALDLLRPDLDDARIYGSNELSHAIGFEGLSPSVAEFDRWLAREVLRTLGGAPWKLDDAGLHPKAGACVACSKRASRERLLFDDVLPAGKELPIAQDRCLDTVCYQEKAVRAVDRNLQELAAKHGRALPVITDVSVATNEVKAARVKHAGAVQLGYAGGWQETSKSTRGAVVGVVVDDPARLGQTVWVRKNSDGGGEKAAEKGQAKVTPLKERRALLERRRRALALEKFRAHLESQGELVRKWKPETPAPALDEKLVERIAPMLCLAATVGTAGNRGERDGSAVGWANVWKDFIALRRCSSDGASVLLVATWRLAADVLPVLIARLNPWGGLEHVDVAWENAGKLADVLKQRAALEQAWSDAVLEITEPKSWAAEEAAGRKGKKTKGAK